MNFTFGICTDYSDEARLAEIVDSIRKLQIPKYEIIFIGGKHLDDESDVFHIYFDETQRPGWVTRKKNLLAYYAKHDNIVLMHDYYVFDSEWYKSFLEFGEDWDVCSNAQLLITGKRHFTDWVIWDSPYYPRYHSMDYDDWTQTKYMYQSGGYVIVKKDFMPLCPMNEHMTWGTAEDVEWSLRMRAIARWKCNGQAIVKHNKVHRDAKSNNF